MAVAQIAMDLVGRCKNINGSLSWLLILHNPRYANSSCALYSLKPLISGYLHRTCIALSRFEPFEIVGESNLRWRLGG